MPVSEVYHGLAPGYDKLSILLRQDGLSCAYREGEEIISSHFSISGSDSQEAFRRIFSDSAWPQRSFSEVRVCVPTHMMVLIPGASDSTENYGVYFTSLGFDLTPETRLFAHSDGGKVLVHAVCQSIVEPMVARYPEELIFDHPLSVSLRQPVSAGMDLQIDGAGGYGNFTLTNGKELLLAEVLPLTEENDLLFITNRLIVSNKVGKCRITCSGDNCTAYAAVLARHYRNVSTHPDLEHRNLYAPWR